MQVTPQRKAMILCSGGVSAGFLEFQHYLDPSKTDAEATKKREKLRKALGLSQNQLADFLQHVRTA